MQSKAWSFGTGPSARYQRYQPPITEMMPNAGRLGSTSGTFSAAIVWQMHAR